MSIPGGSPVFPASDDVLIVNEHPVGVLSLPVSVQQMFDITSAQRTNLAGIGYSIFLRDGTVQYQFSGQTLGQLQFMIMVLVDTVQITVPSLPTANDVFGVGYTMSPFIAPVESRFEVLGRSVMNIDASIDVGTLAFQVPIPYSNVQYSASPASDPGTWPYVYEHNLIFVTYGEVQSGNTLNITAQNVNTLNFKLPIVNGPPHV